MNRQHTPGPWSWDGCGINDASEYKERIVTMPTVPVRDNATRKATGLLIAAAPELLEALETLLPLAIHTSPQDVAIQQARAAILKAKGE